MRDDLDTLRQKIASIDARLLELIAARLQLARRVGQLKHQQQLAITDPEIEALTMQQNLRTAQTLKLPEALVRNLTNLLITYATHAQQEKNNPHCEHFGRHSHL